MFFRVSSVFLFSCLLIAPNHATSQELKTLNDVNGFLARHCQECHSGDSPTAQFNVDSLSSEFERKPVLEAWIRVQEQVLCGLMPPQKQPRPNHEEVRALSTWINTQAARIEQLSTNDQVNRVRRLSRLEYENTIRDLLDVAVDLKDLLPQETNREGFDNDANALHVSPFLMDNYLAAADRALDAAIASGDRPNLIKKRFDIKDERTLKPTGSVYRHEEDGVAIFSSWVSANIQVTLWQFQTRGRGKYRFRISGYGIQTERPVTFHVMAGPMNAAAQQYLIDYFTVPPGEPKVIEFTRQMESNLTIRIIADGLGVTPPQVEKIGVENYKGPGLLIQWVDVEGPLLESWPPPGHQRLFGDLGQARVSVSTPSNQNTAAHRLEVVSEQPLADARTILLHFARRAFRRKVTPEDVQPFLSRFEKLFDQGRSFEQALRVCLKGIMVSPEFLFVRESRGRLDDFSLASRLSYFLWSSMPDEELLTLAERKQLHSPEILRQQVERMLGDPKATAFLKNFVNQWLGLEAIDDTLPDAMLYPEYDDLLKVSMLKEVHLFFEELLRQDLSITHVISSDFSILNGRLAKHYGIDGIAEGVDFQRVKLPESAHRGGFLTMGAILKVTANGTTTSPILRGNWLLSRILGTPPPKPREDVEAVEPDIRGATTIRTQLEKHRSLEQCAGCHSVMDPHGFALENYDVIGGWRERYRSIGQGDPVVVDGRKLRYLNGQPVDAADQLIDGRSFDSIEGYKQLLLADPDQLARSLSSKLLTYALGMPPSFSHRLSIERIVEQAKENHFGLRSLVHLVVQSDAFLSN
jgi:hypothetical protein